MLKVTLDTTAFTALSDDLKAEYQLQGDGSYHLDLGPSMFVTDKDPDALFRALESERAELKKVRGVADKFESDANQAAADGITGVEELKVHFQAQMDAQKKEFAAEQKKQADTLKAQKQTSADSLARTQALAYAQEVFGPNAAIMLPHLTGMMKGVVNEAGQSVVELVDPLTLAPLADQTLEKFKESLSTNPLFKSMVVVSNASGGSANDRISTGLAATNEDGSRKKYSDYESGELVTLKRERPDDFQQLLKTHQQLQG